MKKNTHRIDILSFFRKKEKKKTWIVTTIRRS